MRRGLPLACAAGALTAALAYTACSSGGSAPSSAKSLTPAERMDPAACRSCHADHFAEWSGSMHAYASDDPLFVAMNRRAQRETRGAIGTFCVRCHAPVAALTGATADGLDLAALPAPLRGVTCYFCHSVDAVNGVNDDPLHLADDGVLRAAIANPVATPAHASTYSPLHDRAQLASAQLCGACHDVALESGLPIEQTFHEWQGGVYAEDTPKTRLTCGGCHMTGTEGVAASPPNVVPTRTVHDHSAAAVDRALTRLPEADAQAALVQKSLDGALHARLCVNPPAQGGTVSVTLETAFVGHAWPSGAVHDRRAWVELVASANGQVVLRSGVVPDDQTSVESLADPNLWLLTETLRGTAGDPVLFMWEAASASNASLPVAVTSDPSDPRFDHSVTKAYPVPPTADDVTVRVRLAPVALEVIDALIASGDLAASYRTALPVYTLAGTALEWKQANGWGCVP